MLFKTLFFLYWAQFFVGGNSRRTSITKSFINEKYRVYENVQSTSNPIQPLTSQEPVSEISKPLVNQKLVEDQCPANKSLHSEADIQSLIDYSYKHLYVDDIIKKAYETQLSNMRDIYINDLNQFIGWFNHQPEHLLHILEGLEQVRKQHIEPKIKGIAKLLDSYHDLETQFKDKSTKYHISERNLKRYKAMCSFNCEDDDEHSITKREVKDSKYYCSSLEELYKKVNHRLNKSMIQMKNNITNQLSIESKNYKDVIDNLKSNLKEKALIAFGRTMYEVLILQDEYHHFVQDLNATAIETDIFYVQNLFIQIDGKLLQFQRAVDKYGQYCRNCGNVVLRAVSSSDEEYEDDSLSIVDLLINIKFNETETHLLNEWKQILEGLNEAILETEKDTNLDNLKPIQEEAIKLTNIERDELNKLKAVAPQTTVIKIVELIKKSQELLENINNAIHTIDNLIKA